VTDGVQLVRGGNTPLTGNKVDATIVWRTDRRVDVCALLVASDGKVRDDDDFVFYNQPTHPSGGVSLTDTSDESAAITVDLSALPATIERVVIAGSVETGTIDAVPDLRVEVHSSGGTTACFRVDGIEPVPAAILGELYRRDTAWKFRAVGQGWSSGLAGLATDFGIAVEDDTTSVIAQAEALRELQQMVTFAFADDLIEQHELDEFNDAANRLGISGVAVDAMRARLERGLELAQISEGRVPVVTDTALLLEADEKLHLDTPAVHVRTLDNGSVRRAGGRLVVTSRKLRFVSETGGHELFWSKAVEIRPEYSTVVIAATSRRGGGTYEVTDPERAAAILRGALRLSRRTASVTLGPERDTRAIPLAVKTEVWRRDGGACVTCAATEYLEFDHVIPWSRGGATSVGNLQLLCRSCNLAKGSRL